MRVAVVGAGLAGLSVAWHLASKGVEVEIFDPKGIGGGASGVSTGLMHPFPGKKSARSWRAEEGMESTYSLLDVAEKALGRPVASRTGLFRPAVTKEQKLYFQSLQDPDAEWKTVFLPELLVNEGLWIPKGISVYSHLYLQGLWMACQGFGVRLNEEFYDYEKRDDSAFDAVVFACGWEMIDWPICRPFNLRLVLGQSVFCRWQHPLPFSLVSNGHVSLTEDPQICHLGSTFEHQRFPDPAQVNALMKRIALFYLPAKDLKVEEVRFGIRIAPKKGHIPIVEKVGPKAWIFTGLNSRGMLYHSLLGNELAERILTS